jgi:SMI1 / KNR4 family (SUKH-1)
MSSIQKLLSISSEPLSHEIVAVNIPDFDKYGRLGKELLALLQLKNGFYAFESALHVFPAAPFENEMTLSRWNSFGLWRHEYGALADKKLFFAEDACGNQFCLHEGQIGFFDAETGRVEVLGNNFDEWARRILAEYDVLTSFPLMHYWQTQHGALPIGQRLMLKKPLVLGGDYSLENLCANDAIEGMKLRGHIATQIEGLPEGTQVDFRFTDD